MVASCPRCGANLQNPAEEFQQIAPTWANYVPKSNLGAKQGFAFLSNRRFFWYDPKANNWGIGGGLIGYAIGAAVKAAQDSKTFSIPIETIASVEVEKKGFAKMLVITAVDGTRYPVSLSKPQDWVEPIMANVHYFRQYGQYPPQV